MLENLKPAERIHQSQQPKPSVTFDGTEGAAVTPGYESEPENFDEFLIDAGLDPTDIEVIPPVRTSRWQQQRAGELIWLTAYRFTFRRKGATVDLPLAVQTAKRKVKLKPLKDPAEKALVILWSDLQVGKLDLHGGIDALTERVAETQQRLVKLIKKEKPDRAIFVDLGDTVENFTNKADQQQMVTNQLSIMGQVDLAISYAFDAMRSLAELLPTLTYASVGSNHCQWRINKQAVGKPTDDWGVFIGRQLARLAQETGLDHVTFTEPQEWDESLALDVFGDKYHILGIVHGHQARRPWEVTNWWKRQSFGNQPVAAATCLIHGHFHHLTVEECGMTDYGQSRFRIGAPTLDNGSNWYRLQQGEQAVPGLGVFILEKDTPFTGQVMKL